MNEFEHDLTKGNIWKQLIWFAVPFFISNLIQSLYNLMDMVILGHFGGTNSISAANIGGQILIILTNIASGLSAGGTVMLGNYLGSNRRDKINDAIRTLVCTGIIVYDRIICMYPSDSTNTGYARRGFLTDKTVSYYLYSRIDIYLWL